MLTDEQGLKPVVGFTVYDSVLILHLIEKLLRGGGVTGKELSYVAALRVKAIASAQMACGLDIEQLNNKPAAAEHKNPGTQGG